MAVEGGKCWEQRLGLGCAPCGCGFRWGPGREHLFLDLDAAKGRKKLEWWLGLA